MAWAPDYATPLELAAYLRIGDTDDDTELGFAITAASRAIDRATNRQFGLVGSAQARTYTGRWDRRRGVYVVEHDDLMTATGFVVTNGDDTVVTDYTLEPVNGPQTGRPWTELVLSTLTNPVALTGNWGWSTVPVPIKEATLLQASRLFRRKDAPFGVAGSPDVGSEVRLLAKLDPDVAVAIGPFVRWWAAA